MMQTKTRARSRMLTLGTLVLLLLLLVSPTQALAKAKSKTNPSSYYTVKVDKGYLALRTAPAYDESNEIGELYTGDMVRLVNTKGDKTYWWVYSPKHNKKGYVNKNYLTSGSAYAGKSYQVKVDKGYLALRTAPAYDESNEIGELYTGDTVNFIQSYNKTYWWVYSSKHDRCGYVNKNYLTDKTSGYGDYTVKVDKGYLALRTAPAYDDKNEIGELYTGDTVTVIEKTYEKYWWVYSPKYGKSGYVNKNYLVKK